MIVTCFWFLCWRQMKTGYVALALCLNIGVDPPDVIKISPCARMECWIGNTYHSYIQLFRYYTLGMDALRGLSGFSDPLSTTSSKALDAIGKNLQAQYERWQPRVRIECSGSS